VVGLVGVIMVNLKVAAAVELVWLNIRKMMADVVGIKANNVKVE